MSETNPTKQEKLEKLRELEGLNEATIEEFHKITAEREALERGENINLETEPEEMESTQEEQQTKEKFDPTIAIEEINKYIKEVEAESGTPLPPEKKQEIAREIFLKAKETFQDQEIENAGWLQKPLKKFDKFWSKDLEKTRMGKATKAAVSAAVLGSVTLASAWGLGVLPPSGIATRLLARVSIATGLNMAMTSDLTGKFLNALTGKKENEEEEEKGKFKKLLSLVNIQNTAMIGGLGVSFALGGPLIAGVAFGGVVAKKAISAYFDKKIKENEEKIKNLSSRIEAKNFDDNFDINSFVENLEGIGDEYEKIQKSLSRLKWGKSLSNGVASMTAGITTLAVFDYEKDHDAYNKEILEKLKLEKLEDIKQAEAEIKAEVEAQADVIETPPPQEEAKLVEDAQKIEDNAKESKIDDTPVLNEAIVGKGEGIETAFRRQIEGNEEIAKKLGWDGEEDLHKFSGKAAHRLAIDQGYVEKETGHETRIAIANKVAYEIKLENGELSVYERDVETGKSDLNTVEETKDSKENVATNKYEYSKNKISPDDLLKEKIIIPVKETSSVEISWETGLPTGESWNSVKDLTAQEFYKQGLTGNLSGEQKEIFDKLREEYLRAFMNKKISIPDMAKINVEQFYKQSYDANHTTVYNQTPEATNTDATQTVPENAVLLEEKLKLDHDNIINKIFSRAWPAKEGIETSEWVEKTSKMDVTKLLDQHASLSNKQESFAKVLRGLMLKTGTSAPLEQGTQVDEFYKKLLTALNEKGINAQEEAGKIIEAKK